MEREIGPVGDGEERGWGGGAGDYSHTHSVANERGITTCQCLIGLLFCNQNGWLHSDVIRTWARSAAGRSTASGDLLFIGLFFSERLMMRCSPPVLDALQHGPSFINAD